MHPLKCTHGADGLGNCKCICCGAERKLSPILDALCKLDAAKKEVQAMVWKDALQQGGTVAKKNTQRELQPENMTVKELIGRFKKQFDICIPHYQEICWIDHVKNADFACLRPG